MENLATVKHVYSGKIQQLPFKKIVIETAIFKQEHEQTIYVNKLGIETDEQGDKRFHGGPEQALCVYLEESYRFWEQYTERDIKAGCFGENLVMSGYNEDEVYIGDIFQIGDLVVQVSQPRQPCSRLGFRNNWDEMVVLSRNSKLTGFYLRVLEEGYIQKDTRIERISRLEKSISIKQINRLLYDQQVSADELQYAISIQELGESFRKDLRKKYDKYV